MGGECDWLLILGNLGKFNILSLALFRMFNSMTFIYFIEMTLLAFDPTTLKS